MAATTQAEPKLSDGLQALVDRTEIVELVGRYLASLDRARFDDDWARSLFIEDVEMTFPIGSHEGIDGLAEQHDKIMSKWDRTLHFSANHIVEVNGDEGTIRANLIGTHVHPEERGSEPLFVGELLHGDLVRTEDGWRFSKVRMDLVWRVGDPPPGVEVDEG
jgi:hypothetical protein